MSLDPSKIQLIKDSLARKEPIFFSSSGLDITFQSRILEFNEKYLLIKNTVTPQHIHKFVQSDKFNVRIQMVVFESTVLESDGQDIRLPLTNAIVIEDIRQSTRISFKDKDNVYCQILNPFDQQTYIAKGIMDLSESGLSICTNFDSKLFSPGVCIEKMMLYIHGHEYEDQSGEVIYKRKFMDTNRKIKLQVGIKFHTQLRHNISELQT